MTGDRPNHQQPRTNKRKGKPDISLVLIKRVNLALWLGGVGSGQHSPLGPPWDSLLPLPHRPPGPSHPLGSPPPLPLTPSLAGGQHLPLQSTSEGCEQKGGPGMRPGLASAALFKPCQREERPHQSKASLHAILK